MIQTKNRELRERDILNIGEYYGNILHEFSQKIQQKNPDKKQILKLIDDIHEINNELTQYIDFLTLIRKKIRSRKLQIALNDFKDTVSLL